MQKQLIGLAAVLLVAATAAVTAVIVSGSTDGSKPERSTAPTKRVPEAEIEPIAVATALSEHFDEGGAVDYGIGFSVDKCRRLTPTTFTCLVSQSEDAELVLRMSYRVTVDGTPDNFAWGAKAQYGVDDAGNPIGDKIEGAGTLRGTAGYAVNEPLESPPVDLDGAGPPPAAPADAGSWPAGVSAYTVIVGSFTTRENAEARAQDVGSGAGILRTDDYPGLTPGYWAVFIGRYDSEQQADAAAGRERQTGVADAYIRFVDGR